MEVFSALLALCAGNSPVTCVFPAQRASNADFDVSLMWVHCLFELVIWSVSCMCKCHHYNDVIMGVMASQITSLAIVYSTGYSDADQRKHQSSASLAFVRGIHRWPVNSPHKGPVTRKIFPFDDVIMMISCLISVTMVLEAGLESMNLKWYPMMLTMT